MLGLLVEIPAGEYGQVHEIEIVVKRNEMAEDVARAVFGVQATGDTYPGESLMVPAVADLRTLMVPEYGSYDIRANVDGQPGTYLTLYVTDKLPPGVTPPPDP